MDNHPVCVVARDQLPSSAQARVQSPWQDVQRDCTLINDGSASVPLTNGLRKPLFQVGREDPFSGLGGHPQDDRGDDASWSV